MATICDKYNKVSTPKRVHLTYVMLIDDKYYYVGCCSSNSKKDIDYHRIYLNSGNQMSKAMQRGIISYKEYRERCQIIRVQDSATREEALDLEEEQIKIFKELFGDKCLNISTGNRHRGGKSALCHSYPHLNGERIVSKRQRFVS